MALVLIAVVMMVSVSFDAPLGDSANPGLSPNPTKAPWYFAGLQELLLHLYPLFAVFIIPLILVVALMGIPYFKYHTNTQGIWFASVKGRRMALIAGLIAIVATPAGIVADKYLIDLAFGLSGIPTFLGNGLIPFAFIFFKGEVINPPAPRALDVYHLFIENDIVKVNTGKRIKRSGFLSDQVVYVNKTS